MRSFVKENYEYLYEINFEFENNAKKLFDGNLTIDHLFDSHNSQFIKLIFLLFQKTLFLMKFKNIFKYKRR